MANDPNFNADFYYDPTNDRYVLQGILDIRKADGGVLKVDGTDVSAGLEELANLNGLSSAEVALIDGLTAGAHQAGKALTLDANKTVDQAGFTTITVRAWNATGGGLTKGDLVTFVGTHTNGLPKIVLADANVADRAAVGALQADIADAAAGLVIVHGLSPATLDTSASGTAGDPAYLSETAGAVVYAAETEADERSQVIGYVVVDHATTGQLFYDFRNAKIGSIDMQTGAASLNIGLADKSQSTLAVAAEGGDAIAVTLQLKDANGVNIAEVRPVECYLSSHATSGAIYTDGGITVTASTGEILKEHTDDLIFKCHTDATGALVLSVAGSGDQAAAYLYVEFANGYKISAAIDLAA